MAECEGCGGEATKTCGSLDEPMLNFCDQCYTKHVIGAHHGKPLPGCDEVVGDVSVRMPPIRTTPKKLVDPEHYDNLKAENARLLLQNNALIAAMREALMRPDDWREALNTALNDLDPNRRSKGLREGPCPHRIGDHQFCPQCAE